MSGNYEEEFPLLQKLLRTEAFRFIIVRYNHYSLVERLKADLHSAFPDRPVAEVNAETIDFQTLYRSFLDLQGGIFYVKNFGLLAKEQTTSTGETTPDMEVENDRRRAITAGLNLRRDKLAKTSNALIILVATTASELIVRSLRKKMPDLWSFRSLFLDLEIDIVAELDKTRVIERPIDKIAEKPIIEKDLFKKNKSEIRRLQRSLSGLTDDDHELKLSIYPQLTRLLVENGVYDKAVLFFDEWLDIVGKEEDQIDILFDKGDVLAKKGQLIDAFETFKLTLEWAEKYDRKNTEGLCHERMGHIQTMLGDLTKALEHFQKYRQVETELMHSSPKDATYKYNLAISYQYLGDTHSSLGNLEKALEFFEDYNRLEKELYESYPQNVDYKNGLAISYARLGDTHSSLDNLEKALEFFEDYNRLAKELYESYPQNVDYKNGLAITYERLGNTHSSLGNLEKALEFFEDYNRLAKELYESYPQNVDFKNGLAISYSKLGDTQRLLGNLEKALEFFEDYKRLEKELYESYPRNVYFKNGLAISYAKLGEVFNDKKNEKERARLFFEKAKEIWEELVVQAPQFIQFQRHLENVKDILEEL